VGCAVMGFLLQDKTLFPKEDRYIALYIGLTTGFCGSLTSFSSFMWNCFQALANLDPHYERARGRNVLAILAQIIITLCISIAALRFGAHCAQLTRHMLPSVREITKFKHHLDMLGISLGVFGWITAAIMTGLIPEWRAQLFTALLAPAGIFSHPDS
jgi:fluoride ion exporter CrcB/FEX